MNIWKSPESQAVLVQYVVELFDRFKRAREPKERDWIKYHMHYRSLKQTRDPDMRKADLFIPETKKCIDSFVADIMSVIYPNDEPCRLDPFGEEDYRKAMANMRLLLLQLKKTKGYTVLSEGHQELGKYGTVIYKVYWKNETRVIKSKIPKMKKRWTWRGAKEERVGYKLKDKEITIYDNPVIEVLDIWNFYPHPDAIDVDADCIERKKTTLSELRQLNENTETEDWKYHNLDKIIDVPYTGGEIDEEIKRQKLEATGEVPGQDIENEDVFHKNQDKRIEVLKAHIQWYENKDDKILKDFVVSVGNREVLLQCYQNPDEFGKKEYIKEVYIQDGKRFWGIGIAEDIDIPQRALNNLWTNILNNVKLIINPVIKYDKTDPLLNKRDIRSRPMQMIGMSDMKSVEYDRPPDIVASVFAVSASLKHNIEEITGITRAGQTGAGATIGEKRKTATEFTGLRVASGKRMTHKGRIIEESVLMPILQRFAELNYQYITEKRLMRIFENGEWKDIPIYPEDIDYDLDFTFTGALTMMNKSSMLGFLINFMQMTLNDPSVKRSGLLKRIWETAGLKGGDEIFAEPEPVEPDEETLEGKGLTEEEAMLVREMVRAGASPEEAHRRIMDARRKGGRIESGTRPAPTPPKVREGIPSEMSVPPIGGMAG